LGDRPDLARRLIVEITETAALYNIDESAHFVATLKRLGCRVAIDDFGCGFASFAHLRALDVDIVKIDGSFVRTLGESEDSQAFFRHLVGIAHGLGLVTVAEGVETAQQADILRRIKIGYMQGYYFGVPAIAMRAMAS
jgi:EAL domain-containing protein (putative c-di-GMP-specific phosphodiesterase class I)